MHLRRYTPGDARGAWRVFFAAVHDGAARHYTPEERRAWAPVDEPDPDWEPRLADHVTWVATDVGRIIGFMTMGRDGHLDLAYMAPDHMGQGKARLLYRALIADPELARITDFTTEASHLARSFLARQGWRVEAEQQVERHGVRLTNFRMSARVPPRPVDLDGV